MKNLRISLLILFCFSFFYLNTSSVKAAAIIEPIQEFKAKPNSQLTGYIDIAFTQSDPSIMYISVEKADVEDGTNRQTSYKVSKTENTLANWIILENDVVYKPSNPRYVNNDNVRRVKYTINVPANAEPGSDYAVIIVSERNINNLENTVGVSRDLATSVLITVEGDTIEQADLVSFSTLNNQLIFANLPVQFLATFKNNGNVHVVPRGNIEIFNGNNKIDNITLNPAQSRTLPNKTNTYTRIWSNEGIEEQRNESTIEELEAQIPKNFLGEVIYQIRNFKIGVYTAELQGFAGKQQIKGSVTFIIFPIHLFLTICLALAAFIFFKKFKSQPAKKNNSRTKQK